MQNSVCINLFLRSIQVTPEAAQCGRLSAVLPGCRVPKRCLRRRDAGIWVLLRQGRRTSDGTQVGSKRLFECPAAGAGVLQMAPRSARSSRLGAPAQGPAHFRWHPGRREAAVRVLPRRGRRSSDGTQVGAKLPPGCSCAGTGALQMAPKLARSCRLGAPAPGPAHFRWHPGRRKAAAWVLLRRGRRSSDGTQVGAKRPFECPAAGAGRLKSGRP